MIIVRLMGGLGNQMFQYSAGRRLANVHNAELILDLSWFDINRSRNYELDIFNIRASVIPPDTLKWIPFSQKIWLLYSLKNIIKGRETLQNITERNIKNSEIILNLPDSIYLNGYWQSEKYFADINNIIRAEFSFINPPSDENMKFLKEMLGSNSVSVHVRRSDYISNENVHMDRYICDKEYYMKGISKIMDLVDDPVFFIFSDDPNWVQQYITTEAPVSQIHHNVGIKNYEDLRLMMHCKHHIIANSSFSWWGAWLGENKEKIVIAPARWFRNQKLEEKNRDIVPRSWLRI